MNECIGSTVMEQFTSEVFDEDGQARQAAEIMQAILVARSPRLSDIAQQMAGKADAGYKRVQRFLGQADPEAALQRLYQADAEFVICDPTEMERPRAKKTAYVGTLSDGETLGYWAIVLATPFRGRAIPFRMLTYSSRTLQTQDRSRNLEHRRTVRTVKALIGDKPLVMDREFSYLDWIQVLELEQVPFVIRLNLRSHPPKFTDADGQPVALTLKEGERRNLQGVFYKGEVQVNLAATWRTGLKEPLWIMMSPTIPCQRGRILYDGRMKIEESFKDLKSLLGIHKAMPKTQANLDKMLALTALTYCVGLLSGEALRDALYAPPAPDQPLPDLATQPIPDDMPRKWRAYSGLFVLIKHKIDLTAADCSRALSRAFDAFVHIVRPYPPVRSCV
jgi:hypothetical protein